MKIYDCKLFKCSTRKDKIIAAMMNPINLELVKQVEDMIDDDELIRIEPEKTTSEESDNDEKKIRKSEHSEGKSPAGKSSGPSDLERLSDKLDSEGEGSPEPTKEPDSKDVEESKHTPDLDSIDASYANIGYLTNEEYIASQVDVIKGTLNSRQDTAGVVRVVCNDAELWVYYGDKYNLNNVMEPVIALFNASDYGYLEFNRLARTDNAIVFDVLDSPHEVRPIKAVEDEK